MDVIAVDALACYRLTRLVVKDELTAGMRSRIEHAMHQGTRSADVAAKLSTLIQCPWCSSWWIACGVVAARRFAPRLWDPVAHALAFSAVTGIVSENV